MAPALMGWSKYIAIQSGLDSICDLGWGVGNKKRGGENIVMPTPKSTFLFCIYSDFVL